MAKETFYFQHDYNARNDDKILELRSRYNGEGYGIFWMLVETMAENDNGGVKATLMGGLSQGYGVAKEWLIAFINDCIEIGLLYEEEGCYYSKRLLTHKEFRKVLSENGALGAAKRWRGYSHPNAKERKGKENKAISFDEENKFAIFESGYKQELGNNQLLRLSLNDLKPQDVIKGQIN